MSVLRLQNTYVVASDMERVRAFYEDGLGLGRKFADGDRWIQYDAGGSGFALCGAEEAPDGAVGIVPVFEVADIEAAVANLAARDTPVGAIRDMGSHGRTAMIRDPAGNPVQLFQRAARPAE